MLSLLLAAMAGAQGEPAGGGELAARLSREFGGEWQAEVWGRTVWAKGTIAETAAIDSKGEALAQGGRFVARCAPILGLGPEELESAGVGETDCQYGVEYRQVIGGVPVEGARFDVTFLKRTGGGVSLTGTLYPNMAITTVPAVPPEDAARTAWNDLREQWRRYIPLSTSWEQIPAAQKVLQESRLVILPPDGADGAPRLAWRLSYGAVVYRVDALTGAIIDAEPAPKE